MKFMQQLVTSATVPWYEWKQIKYQMKADWFSFHSREASWKHISAIYSEEYFQAFSLLFSRHLNLFQTSNPDDEVVELILQLAYNIITHIHIEVVELLVLLVIKHGKERARKKGKQWRNLWHLRHQLLRLRLSDLRGSHSHCSLYFLPLACAGRFLSFGG